MGAYTLTRIEAWALAWLLHLPVQPGSALADWLHSGPAPDTGLITSYTVFEKLSARDYYFGAQTEKPFPAGLLRALTLTSVNAATLTVVIRAGGKASLTRFAQAGDSIVQYGMDEYGMSLHDVMPMHQLAQDLLPRWFTAGVNENLRDDLPFGAFLLFKHACSLADWALMRSDLQSDAFLTSELLETFQKSAAWLDIFNAAGMRGVSTVADLPLSDLLDLLIERGYFKASGQHLTLGRTGNPLAQALSAGDSCTLTITLQTWEDLNTMCGVFLHGNQRLFLLEFSPAQIRICQLKSIQEGQQWIAALLDQGRQAHYVEYLIPIVRSDQPVQTVSVRSRPHALVAPSLPRSPETPTRTCSQCGSPISATARYCLNCGAQQLTHDVTISAPTVDSDRTVLYATPPTTAWLVVLDGPLAHQRFPLGETLRLGRQIDNDLALHDNQSSRHHAIIQRRGTRYQIIDLNSSNGTWVNGVRINGPTDLANGDTILVGNTRFTFHTA